MLAAIQASLVWLRITCRIDSQEQGTPDAHVFAVGVHAPAICIDRNGKERKDNTFQHCSMRSLVIHQAAQTSSLM